MVDLLDRSRVQHVEPLLGRVDKDELVVYLAHHRSLGRRLEVVAGEELQRVRQLDRVQTAHVVEVDRDADHELAPTGLGHLVRGGVQD